MAVDTKRPGFLGALKQFFGLKPGETLTQFAAEAKTLTQADKQELCEGLRAAGYDCDDPLPSK